MFIEKDFEEYSEEFDVEETAEPNPKLFKMKKQKLPAVAS